MVNPSNDQQTRDLQAAVRAVLAAEEHVVRAWVREDLRAIVDTRDAARTLSDALNHPAAEAILLAAIRKVVESQRDELLLAGLDDAKFATLARRVVDSALAATPIAQSRAAPAKELALFHAPSAKGPLAPAAAHQASARHLQIASELMTEPLAAYVARDPWPLPATEDREGYHGERHFDYWASGLEDWLKLGAVLKRHGAALRPGDATLDFGCATGRLLRHELCQGDGLEVWGVDLNERHLLWLYAHMPKALRVFQCTTLPTLPLPDDRFALVTAFSVFTHIDEFELMWLAELRRILAPGGIAYLTIHSEHTWSRVGPGMTLFEHLMAARDLISDHRVSAALFHGPMPKDKTVFRWVSASLNNTNVFLSRRHITEVWGRFFEVLEIVEEGAGYQDVAVLRKPR